MSKTLDSWPSKDGLRVGFLNINHVLNKITDVSHILDNSGKHFHVFGFAESRLSKHISDSEVSVPGYNIIRKDPLRPMETGLLVYIHQSIDFKQVDPPNHFGIESLWVQVKFKRSKPVLFGFMYKKPQLNVLFGETTLSTCLRI